MRRMVFILALVAGTPALAAEPSSADGYAVAEAQCAACHALTGVEETRRTGAPPFPDIGVRYPGPSLEARLAVVLRQGHYAMPARPAVTAEQRAAVAVYIREVAGRGEERP